jgi:lipopolysaccharide/colanic/teichoic acid biosynthesis glycosyltransferase
VLDDRRFAAQLGAAGRARILRDFRSERIWSETASLYRQLIREYAPAIGADLGQGAAVLHRWSLAPLALKRIADLAGAVIGLALTAPLMACAAVAIRLTMGAPVLFRQRRTGRYGRDFIVTKFRTMRDARDKTGRLLPDAERLTPLGQFLRSFSIDELPQLWNVLKGDMSLVGQASARYARSTPIREAAACGPAHRMLQVNGPTPSLQQAACTDSWYVERWSPGRPEDHTAHPPPSLTSAGSRVCQEAKVDDRGQWRQLTDIRPGKEKPHDPRPGQSPFQLSISPFRQTGADDGLRCAMRY